MSIRLSLLAATVLAAAAALPAHAVPLVGVVGNNLVGFDSAAPGTFTSSLTVTGLGNNTIRGIDFRPSNGLLYAFAQPNFNQPASLYTINTSTGAASLVGPVNTSAPIDFGVAFNPVPDAIRIVSADNTNLRVNPTTAATTVDGRLAYAATDRNAGVDPSMTGVAYTNQNPGPQSATTLYGIDSATSSLVIQTPPNDGTLQTVGALGVNLFNSGGTGVGTGFDIDGASGLAFASLTLATGGNNLYGINLTTGAATLIGGFGANTVRDIAVGTIGAPTAVPEPASMAILGLGLVGMLAARRRAR